MARKKASNIMAEFKAKQSLVKKEEAPKDLTRGFNKKPGGNRTTYDPYTSYKAKLDLGLLNKFNTRDIAYFFRDVANENGVKYIISNITKDMKCYKVCISKGYSVEELLAMIEFLFTSGQQYLRVETIQPTILMSTWCNTIYADTQLWLKDEYDPNIRFKKPNKHTTPVREWKEPVPEEDRASIGDWGD